MNWSLSFLREADRDLDNLDHSQQVLVKKAIKKVQQNPLPQSEGGYGKPLGHKHGFNLTNLLKVKLRDAGIRIVYKLERTNSKMIIIVVGIRADEEVYEIAHTRRTRNDL